MIQKFSKISKRTINIVAFAATLISLASVIFWAFSWWKTRQSPRALENQSK